MNKFIIRNDDVAYDTDLDLLSRFCTLCDDYGYRILQGIIPFGEYRKANVSMSNDEIVMSSDKSFRDNEKLLHYLYYHRRHDLIGVHGLFHTHTPTLSEIVVAKRFLELWGFTPTYFVPPFNEGDYSNEIGGLKLCQLSLRRGERLEDFLRKGTPTADIMYLHSWRFDGSWYTLSQLEECLKRLSNGI